MIILLILSLVFTQSSLGEARVKVLEDVERAWAQSGERPAHFEVLETKSGEYKRLFPKGLDHLPKVLVPREIYPATTEQGARRWQYLGTRTLSKFHFVVFRLVT